MGLYLSLGDTLSEKGKRHEYFIRILIKRVTLEMFT